MRTHTNTTTHRHIHNLHIDCDIAADNYVDDYPNDNDAKLQAYLILHLKCIN